MQRSSGGPIGFLPPSSRQWGILCTGKKGMFHIQLILVLEVLRGINHIASACVNTKNGVSSTFKTKSVMQRSSGGPIGVLPPSSRQWGILCTGKKGMFHIQLILVLEVLLGINHIASACVNTKNGVSSTYN
ncbi:hypothetical protein SUGI_0853400 [Cryptomeria japonica]|nr:hypothetical protein SUGI_0853400 [Cryptomeria japonica]